MPLGKRAEKAQRLLLELFGSPAIDARRAEKLLRVNFQTANKLLEILQNWDCSEK